MLSFKVSKRFLNEHWGGSASLKDGLHMSEVKKLNGIVNNVENYLKTVSQSRVFSDSKIIIYIQMSFGYKKNAPGLHKKKQILKCLKDYF